MRLLADCGNTTVKLALAEGRVLLRAARCEPRPVAWQDFLGQDTPEELVLLPGARGYAGAVEAWWPGRIRTVGGDLDLPPVGQYVGMGLDRIVAGLGLEGPALVIDAGTATTFGAWSGTFLGGLILPGAAACAAGLAAAAPALPMVTPGQHDARACQRDTAGALAAALGIGYPAMVAACADRLATETGLTRRLLTGGNAPALAAAGLQAEHDPWLVLRGLAVLAAG